MARLVCGHKNIGIKMDRLVYFPPAKNQSCSIERAEFAKVIAGRKEVWSGACMEQFEAMCLVDVAFLYIINQNQEP